MSTPAICKFTKSDEWVLVEGATATLGITDYAQEQLSDVVFVEILVEAGGSIAKNSTIATVESVKAASDVNAPISGKVIAKNEGLQDNPGDVNTDPYGKAWMIKVEVTNPSELDSLMDAAAYDKYCSERSH